MPAPWTAPTTAVAGTVLPATRWNTDVRDNALFLARPPRAWITATANQSIPNATWTALTLGAPNLNDGFTLASNKLTATVAGQYAYQTSVRWDVNSAGFRLLRVTLNAATWYEDDRQAVNGTNTSNGIAGYLSFAVGDQIGVELYQNSGAALNTVGTSHNLSIHLVSLP